MIPPVDNTEHLQWFMHLLKILQPFSEIGEKKSKASECFNQAMQKSSRAPSFDAFEHSVEILPELKSFQKMFELIAPKQTSPLGQKTIDHQKHPYLLNQAINQPQHKTITPQTEPTQKRNEATTGEPIENVLATLITPLNIDSFTLEPFTRTATFETAELIEEIKNAINEFIIPYQNESIEKPSQEHLQKIAIRLNPMIHRLIENIETFSSISPLPSKALLPHSQHVHEKHSFEKPRGAGEGIKWEPETNQAKHTTTQSIPNPRAISTDRHHEIPSKITTHQAAQILWRFRDPKVHTESSKDITIAYAMPYLASSLPLSPQTKRKKDKKNPTEDLEEEFDSINDNDSDRE